MNLEELKKLLDENVELKKQLMQELITDKTVTSLVDSKVTQGINTFKENGMTTILETKKEEWKKDNFEDFAKQNGLELNPELAILKNEMKLLKSELNTRKVAEAKATIRGKVVNKLAEDKLNPKLANFISFDNEEGAFENLDLLKGVVNDIVEERVKGKLNEKKIVDTGKTGVSADKNPFAKDTLNYTKQIEILKADPEKAKELKELANK